MKPAAQLPLLAAQATRDEWLQAAWARLQRNPAYCQMMRAEFEANPVRAKLLQAFATQLQDDAARAAVLAAKEAKHGSQVQYNGFGWTRIHPRARLGTGG